VAKYKTEENPMPCHIPDHTKICLHNDESAIKLIGSIPIIRSMVFTIPELGERKSNIMPAITTTDIKWGA